MTEQSQFALLGKKRFLPFFLTQLLGAFNDNIFKQSLILAILFKISADADKSLLVNLCALLFILPFFLFSALGGQFAAPRTVAFLGVEVQPYRAFAVVRRDDARRLPGIAMEQPGRERTLGCRERERRIHAARSIGTATASAAMRRAVSSSANSASSGGIWSSRSIIAGTAPKRRTASS